MYSKAVVVVRCTVESRIALRAVGEFAVRGDVHRLGNEPAGRIKGKRGNVDGRGERKVGNETRNVGVARGAYMTRIDLETTCDRVSAPGPAINASLELIGDDLARLGANRRADRQPQPPPPARSLVRLSVPSSRIAAGFQTIGGKKS